MILFALFFSRAALADPGTVSPWWVPTAFALYVGVPVLAALVIGYFAFRFRPFRFYVVALALGIGWIALLWEPFEEAVRDMETGSVYRPTGAADEESLAGKVQSVKCQEEAAGIRTVHVCRVRYSLDQPLDEIPPAALYTEVWRGRYSPSRSTISQIQDAYPVGKALTLYRLKNPQSIPQIAASGHPTSSRVEFIAPALWMMAGLAPLLALHGFLGLRYLRRRRRGPGN